MFKQDCPRCKKPAAVECPTADWSQPPCCDECKTELSYEGRFWCTVCQSAVEHLKDESDELGCACS